MGNFKYKRQKKSIKMFFKPLRMFILCFSPSTLFMMKDGLMKTYEHFNAGEEVFRYDFTAGGLAETRVITMALVEGNFTGKAITLTKYQPYTTHVLEVTDEHMMIYYNDASSNTAWAKTAAEVNVGDYMLDSSGSKMQVTKIDTIFLDQKVYVETESGTIFAQNTLTSGFCDTYELNGETYDYASKTAETVISDFQKLHP